MRTLPRTLLIVLIVLVVVVVALSFLPNDRPVRTVERDVTSELTGGTPDGG